MNTISPPYKSHYKSSNNVISSSIFKNNLSTKINSKKHLSQKEKTFFDVSDFDENFQQIKIKKDSLKNNNNSNKSNLDLTNNNKTLTKKNLKYSLLDDINYQNKKKTKKIIKKEIIKKKEKNEEKKKKNNTNVFSSCCLII